MKKIVFPTDFSDTAQNAFRFCLVLADHLDAEIELIHAVYPEYEALDLPVMAAKATKDKIEVARTALQSFVELGITQVQMVYSFNQLPVVRPDVEVGSPVGIISRVAKRDDVDLIVMGTQGEHNAFEKTLGSVTTGVMENAPCSVLVIPEKANFKDKTVVAYATDLSEADPYHIWKTGELLQPLHPLMHIVHVQQNKGTAEVNFTEMENFFENKVPALQIQFHHVKGDSVTESLEVFVENHEVDMLVMYAPNHNLLERLFKKSNTKRMAMETEVPLLILKK